MERKKKFFFWNSFASSGHTEAAPRGTSTLADPSACTLRIFISLNSASLAASVIFSAWWLVSPLRVSPFPRLEIYPESRFLGESLSSHFLQSPSSPWASPPSTTFLILSLFDKVSQRCFCILKDVMCRGLHLTPCALMVELKAFQQQDNWGGGKQSLPRGFKLHHCIRLILHLIIH